MLVTRMAVTRGDDAAASLSRGAGQVPEVQVFRRVRVLWRVCILR